MNNRINIANILGRYGDGIKLYDVQRGKYLIFDSIGEDDNIYLTEEGSDIEVAYNEYATLFDVAIYPNAATMLIPSPNNPDWKHFFQPGDVVVEEDGNMWFLVNKVSSDYRHFSALYAIDLRNGEISNNFNEECNMVTDQCFLVSASEYDVFIDKIQKKDNGTLDGTLLKVIPHRYNFKPKDWCLMRDTDEGYDKWTLCQFSHSVYEDRAYYVAVGGKEYTECIPYEGNESLLGTDKKTIRT